ncbi:hypothetical protein CRM22_010129, partial [Opisthorchis felineus]
MAPISKAVALRPPKRSSSQAVMDNSDSLTCSKETLCNELTTLDVNIPANSDGLSASAFVKILEFLTKCLPDYSLTIGSKKLTNRKVCKSSRRAFVYRIL